MRLVSTISLLGDAQWAQDFREDKLEEKATEASKFHIDNTETCVMGETVAKELAHRLTGTKA